MQPRLLITSGPLAGTCRHLDGKALSIGRDESNDLCFADPAVSRKHCRIEQAKDHVEIIDLESHNGTFVNDVPVRRKNIDHGHTIRVGTSELVFLLHDGEDAGQALTRFVDSTSADEYNTVQIEDNAMAPGFGTEVGRMARDLATLIQVSIAINSIRDLDALQRELLRLIFEVVPADQGAVVLVNEPDQEPDAACSWSRKKGADKPFGMERQLISRAIWERAPVVANSVAAGGQNRVCVPLVGVEKVVGVLYFASKGLSGSFRDGHIQFLDAVSRVAAVAIENVSALDALRSENLKLKGELNPAKRLVGESAQIRRLEDVIKRVGQSDATILIRGESGTGKEVVAWSIHQNSARHDKPFVAINCAAIPETLIESELFGHEKGAFTGAQGMKKGKFETSADGTLFLDEVGELPIAMQAKLLRALQQREFERIGGAHPIPLRARVLAATNKNLEQAIKANEFRQDLYYRLNVVPVAIPPLRERRDDIPLLALYFAAKFANKNGRPCKGISKDARTLLVSYSWPGNVRELENAIEHAVVLGLTDEILPEDLPDSILEEQAGRASGARYHDALNAAKKELVRSSLREANGSIAGAARLLGIHPKYLHRLIRNFDVKSG